MRYQHPAKRLIWLQNETDWALRLKCWGALFSRLIKRECVAAWHLPAQVPCDIYNWNVKMSGPPAWPAKSHWISQCTWDDRSDKSTDWIRLNKLEVALWRYWYSAKSMLFYYSCIWYNTNVRPESRNFTYWSKGQSLMGLNKHTLQMPP